MYKKLLFLFLSLSNLGYAVESVSVKSKITEVTVFFSGAEVTRMARVKLNLGKQILILEKLPGELEKNSIQVKSVLGSKILSVKHESSIPPSEKKNPIVGEMQDQVEELKLENSKLTNQLAVFELEEDMILANNKFNGKFGGASLDEVKSAASYYREKLNEIREEKLFITQELKENGKRINELYKSINMHSSAERVQHSRILATIESSKADSVDITFSYYIPSAGWKPFYDFRVDKIHSPLTIVYNANVFQSSGEDWKNVLLTLSTNNPALSGEKPDLIPWYVNEIDPYAPKPVKKKEMHTFVPGTNGIRGQVIDRESGETIPFANIQVMQDGFSKGGGITDFDGNYQIKPMVPGEYDIEVSYVGYAPYRIKGVIVKSDQTTRLDMELESEAKLLTQDVVVYAQPLIDPDNTSTGARLTSRDIQRTGTGGSGTGSGKSRYYVNSSKLTSGVTASRVTLQNIPTRRHNSVANLSYKVEIPYSIPSDGKDFSLRIKEVDLQAKYIHKVVPKLDLEAFLIAEIDEWTDLKLLSGETNIYFKGTFVGKSRLDVNEISDTLNISLGRDRDVLVTRTMNSETNDRRINGSTVRETIGFVIEVKNNRGFPINLIIEDQIPLSDRRSVVIENLGAEDAELDKKQGLLVWNLNLNPGERITKEFAYAIKYPKYRSLVTK